MLKGVICTNLLLFIPQVARDLKGWLTALGADEEVSPLATIDENVPDSTHGG